MNLDDMQGKLTELESGQQRLTDQIQRETTERTREHGENSKRLDKFELALNGIPGDTTNIGLVRTVGEGFTELRSYGKATVFWAKILAWAVMVAIGIFGLWFARLEAHHLLTSW